ncbi:glycerophosphoryl diester phosphodiesterase [Vibrio sp. HA2012]|uniref:glycerophosphodiester phosphodiesterase family protein n=1 Tax=Vibrio sp. HA2012 TaxID=1971595 RepID=UPI000C2C83C7|nr:glycerophosphodiester phosphodiesterase family protein [Vibrio sp. HA2012]PJC85064.1 glycerophosphoryl diester phosphodiesterase [Vibrio sp. HA2012]
MIIAAHRGLSSKAPENTLSAFLAAIKLGCSCIELDTHLSEDNIPVVIHDQSVDRCTDGCGSVRDMSLTELKKLDAGLWFGEAFRGERIPALDEVLRLGVQFNIQLNIELKCYHTADVTLTCEQVARVICSQNIPSELLLFSSFNTDMLRVMQLLLPDIRRGHLWDQIPENALDILHFLNASSANCDYRFLTEKQTRQLKDAGYQVFCYTPNVPKLVAPLRKWGVDMLITDYPDRYFFPASN